MKIDIKTREYTTVSEVSGPLMIVEGVEGVNHEASTSPLFVPNDVRLGL